MVDEGKGFLESAESEEFTTHRCVSTPRKPPFFPPARQGERVRGLLGLRMENAYKV